jgi:phage terminase Nu1 subunit (DNA packaging protein)
MKKLKDIADIVLTTRQIGELLQISPQHLSGLERAGRIKRLGPNQWPLLATTQSYLRSLRESRQHDNSEALRRVREAQLKRLELANAARERELIPTADAEFVVDAVCGFVRTELGSLPQRCSRDINEQRRLEAEVDCTLNRISDKLAELEGSLRTGKIAA